MQNYLRYLAESPHAWMLARFVCPTTKLQEAIALAKAHPEGRRLRITALGQQAPAAEFLVSLQNDIDMIRKAQRAWGDASFIDMIEFALPKDAAIAELAPRRIAPAIAEVQGAHLKCFFEIPFGPIWRDDVVAVWEIFLAEPLYGMSGVGLKIRTGGLTVESFPSEADVAFFIDRCRSAMIPWKATAGLHHPRRHWDKSINVWHHGFFNVFGAGILSATNSLTEANVADILADREGIHFQFEPDRLVWKDWSCSAEQIRNHRLTFATSFGSCSFTEPCEDLEAMGLIEASK